MADAPPPKDAGEFFKQLGERVLTQSAPAAGLAGLDRTVKFITLETRSAILPRLTIDRPFASSQPGGPNTGDKPTILGGSPGLLQSLRPKVVAYGYDDKSVLTWAPYGEPGKHSLGEPEAKAIGGALVGLGAVFGLGWWLGRRHGAKHALRRLKAR